MSAAASRLKPQQHTAFRLQKTPQSFSKPHGFLHMTYEAHPQPINCTTFHTTRDALTNKSNPHHIKVSRRIAQFDAGKLHWNTSAPVDTCKKALIRGWATRRLANAFVFKLKEKGYQRDGTRIQKDGQPALSGALVIRLRDQPESLTASKEEVRKSAEWVLQQVIAVREKAGVRKTAVNNTWAQREERARHDVVGEEVPRVRSSWDTRVNDRPLSGELTWKALELSNGDALADPIIQSRDGLITSSKFSMRQCISNLANPD